jgi:SAM-dependent methyltransferase
MTAWSRGYVADSLYVSSYQAAQSPAGLALSCAMMGVQAELPPDLAIADLGCGRGLTANVLAAANPGWTVLGIDYQPAHVAEAAALAADAGLGNVVFADADLAELSDAEIDQLPELDVVMLHGLWTWVSDAVRAGVVRLLARRLKPGGLCYVGYNALPVFARDFALQRLLTHAAAAQRGDSAARAAAAIDSVRALHATRPAQLAATPLLRHMVGESPAGLAAFSPAYVAHEFLTAHWRPVFFGDLARDLAAAQLDFVGCVALHQNLPALQFDADRLAVWESLPPGAARELVQDLCAGRSFRRDVFVRGHRPVNAEAALDRVRLAAVRPLDEEPPRLEVPTGLAELPLPLWAPIAAALAHGPCTIADLRERVRPARPTAAELAALLVGTGSVAPVLREGRPQASAQRFNEALAAAAPAGGPLPGRPALAAPALGAGLPCDALSLQVAAAGARGGFDPTTLAARLLAAVEPAAATAEAELASQIEALWQTQAPVWRSLGIVP